MKRIILPLSLIFLLAACLPDQPLPANTQPAAPSVSPTKTMQPTRTSTLPPTITIPPTMTPTATPWPTITPSGELTDHTWTTEPVLVYYSIWGGDCYGCGIGPGLPEIVLYSDGRIFIQASAIDPEDPHHYIFTKQLSPREICAFLNTIDQIGYLDYDPDNYGFDRFGRRIQSYPTAGAGLNDIYINVWQSTSASFYNLGFFIEDDFFQEWSEEALDQPPAIADSLESTYYLLETYFPANLEYYIPESIEIRFLEPYGKESSTLWPVDLPPLSELAERSQPHEDFPFMNILRLSGDDASQIIRMFDKFPNFGEYTDGETTYSLYIVPLLPYSAPNTKYFELSWVAVDNTTPPPTTLTCQPSDGLLAIPAP